MRQFLRIVLSSLLLVLLLPGFTFADTNANLQSQIDSDNQQIQILTQKIAEYQAKLNQLGADRKTLQDAINALNLQRSKIQAQVAITQHQISATQAEIQQLGGQIDNTKQTIARDQAAIASFLHNIQQADQRPLLVQVLTTGDLGQFWNDMTETLQAQDAVRQKVDDLHNQEDNLANTQASVQQKQDQLTVQKASLASQQKSLTATEASQTQLLAQTKSQEAQYQKLLAAAQKELQSYSAFTQNAGGANLLPHNAPCDAWGCYYNQRDAAWGGLPLNGTNYSLAGDGCLITSMAMVMTHYGYPNVTPVSINSNPANFASYYPAYLLYTISADGVTATRTAAAIDGILAAGHPVIVGLHAYGGTHFVVLVSGSRGNYLMKDPYVANANNIPFSSHYTMREIYSISKVVIGG